MPLGMLQSKITNSCAVTAHTLATSVYSLADTGSSNLEKILSFPMITQATARFASLQPATITFSEWPSSVATTPSTTWRLRPKEWDSSRRLAPLLPLLYRRIQCRLILFPCQTATQRQTSSKYLMSHLCSSSSVSLSSESSPSLESPSPSWSAIV